LQINKSSYFLNNQDHDLPQNPVDFSCFPYQNNIELQNEIQNQNGNENRFLNNFDYGNNLNHGIADLCDSFQNSSQEFQISPRYFQNNDQPSTFETRMKSLLELSLITHS